MGLRIRGRRARLLRELLRYGEADIYAHSEGYLLEEHQLIERFNDANRILEDRWRLTWKGAKVAHFLFDKEET